MLKGGSAKTRSTAPSGSRAMPAMQSSWMRTFRSMELLKYLRYARHSWFKRARIRMQLAVVDVCTVFCEADGDEAPDAVVDLDFRGPEQRAARCAVDKPKLYRHILVGARVDLRHLVAARFRLD